MPNNSEIGKVFIAKIYPRNVIKILLHKEPKLQVVLQLHFRSCLFNVFHDLSSCSRIHNDL